jgi:hypothetical protein
MQKVEGSSPFIRSHESPAPAGLSRSRRGTSANLLPRLSPRSADVTGARARMNDARPKDILSAATGGGSRNACALSRMDASGQRHADHRATASPDTDRAFWFRHGKEALLRRRAGCSCSSEAAVSVGRMAAAVPGIQDGNLDWIFRRPRRFDPDGGVFRHNQPCQPQRLRTHAALAPTAQ